ncbi:hypothetical protein ACT1WM_20775 [Bacillus stercoris]|uniref:hypothetical protein n=1 Tax=Bacillus subtilis group TaxID=653685 RepID=UPI001B9C951E|nr:hypothetical protein [Bacillus subtilis]CAF1784877.1 hypothetical protein NRS6107_04046 [Bacillus subtilis]CAI6329835.1 hypothetical protein NRS6107_21240 [Bacillus subtilis]
MAVRFLSFMLSLFWGISMFSYWLKIDSVSFSDKYWLAFFICGVIGGSSFFVRTDGKVVNFMKSLILHGSGIVCLLVVFHPDLFGSLMTIF